MPQLLVIKHFPGRAVIENRSGIKNDGAVAQIESRNGVLLNNDGRDALFADQVQGFLDFMNDNRRQNLIRFIHQQQLDVTVHCPAD